MGLRPRSALVSSARGLAGLALVLAIGILFLTPKERVPLETLLILAAMAFMAELVPVEVSRRGVRITFTLPYVAALAVIAGPPLALAVDVLATTAAGIYHSRHAPRHGVLWHAINASVSAIAVTVGSICYLVADLWLAAVPGAGIAEAVVFMLGYGAANFLLVTYLEWVTTGRRFHDNLSHSLRLSFWSYGVYAIVAAAITAIVLQGLIWLVPFTLVPVWALRTGIDFRARMYEHYYETITALSLMLQRAHPYTHGHLERVASVAEEVARRLGVPRQRVGLIREAAVLHDIGKIAVDERILDKPARLTDEEMAHVRRHAEWGALILAPVKQFHEMIPWIRHHHERPDGTGYPDRLTDVEIPLESKIIAVIDAFDAMTGGGAGRDGKRTYRDPVSVPEALAELERCAGTQFDRRVVAAFREVLEAGT